MTKRWLLALGLVVLAGAGIAVAGIVIWQQRTPPGSIPGSSSVEFVISEAPGATTRPEKVVNEVPWPNYQYDDARTGFAPDLDHRPPFRKLWEFDAGSLVEFPPVVAYGRLYFGTLRGRLFAVDAETGEVAWRVKLGRCTAASPAVGDGVVYQPIMYPTPCSSSGDVPGFMAAFDADTGEELWRFRAGVIESSPLLIDGTLYFGSWDRKMYALDVRTRKVRWTFSTGDRIKGGPAYRDGTIYFGSYDGNVYAVDARTGRERWSASGEANFYATPALAYGRVYIGNTDGRVYAFGAKSGNLLWATSTGGYVYSAAGIWNRTVYAGSHSHRFFALDAGTGAVRWSFEANGPITGAATVLDRIVYFSTTRGRTYGLDARNGRQVFSFPDGAYTPIVADEERVYLVGYKTVYGLESRR